MNRSVWMASPFTGLGCDRAFCGAYWHAMRAAGSDVYPVCNQETLKPVSKSFYFNLFQRLQFLCLLASSRLYIFLLLLTFYLMCDIIIRSISLE